MNEWPVELRLYFTLLLSALTAAGPVALACRNSAQLGRRIMDSILLCLLAQYVAVGACGLAGVLHFGWIAAASLAASAVMWAISRKMAIPGDSDTWSSVDRWGVGGCAAFSAAFVLAIVHLSWIGPVIANDSMIYHLPAAIQWIQTGRIGLFENIWHNPANTYSPLAGSMWMAWWIAPMGSEVLARYVQLPALVLIGAAVFQIATTLGARPWVAALLAISAMHARPIVAQLILPKDDLFACALAVVALISMHRSHLGDRLGAARLGIALGLLLATKYTAVLALPLLLSGADMLVRSEHLRRTLLAGGIAAVLSGGWYIRNWLLTGNPLFPTTVSIGDWTILAGLFSPARASEFSSLQGLGRTFVTGYLAPPAVLGAAILFTMSLALAASTRRVLTDGLARAVIIGSFVCVAAFLAISPFAEIRFIYAAIVCGICGCALVRPSVVQGTFAFALAIVSVATSFVPDVLFEQLPRVAVALLVVGSVMLFTRIVRSTRVRAVVATVVVLLGAGYAYVHFPAFVEVAYVRARWDVWSTPGLYEPQAQAWFVADRDVPAGSRIAVAGTELVLPLMGTNLDRRVVFVPMRSGIRHLHDLPRSRERISGESIADFMRARLAQPADVADWRARLEECDADYLFVAIVPGRPQLPERTAALNDPEQFRRIFASESAEIYEIRRRGG